jgi:hypothetical protein
VEPSAGQQQRRQQYEDSLQHKSRLPHPAANRRLMPAHGAQLKHTFREIVFFL